MSALGTLAEAAGMAFFLSSFLLIAGIVCGVI